MTNVTNIDSSPRPEGTAQPTQPPIKLSEGEAAALIHDSYMVQIKEQSCNHCSAGEKWSQIFEVWVSPTTSHRTSAHVLRPSLTLRAGLPVAYIRLPTVVVPVCSDCIENYNPQQDSSPIPALSHEAWRETLRRKYAPAPAMKSGRPEPSLDSL